MAQYNGWTNYETWRMHLEMFDGSTAEDYGVRFSGDPDDRDDEIRDLKDALQCRWDEHVEEQCKCNTLQGFLQSFAADVNWQEIAEHLAPEVETAPLEDIV